MPTTCRPTGKKGYDGKCPDGFITNGWRRINRGGYVNFQHAKRYAPEFADWSGLWVFMEIADCYAIDAICYPDTPFQGTPFATYNQDEWAALSDEDKRP